MDATQRFMAIAGDKEREKDIIPFLQKLTRDERTRIGEAVIASDREEERDRLVAFRIARYACFDSEQIKGIDWHWYSFATPQEVDSMIDWYIPDWFAGYLSEQRAKNNILIKYKYVLKWRRLGLFGDISPEEIADGVVLHFHFYKWSEDLPEATAYISEWIRDYPEILEDIKGVFRYPTAAFHVDKGSFFRKTLQMGPIAYIFKHYSETGVFDRQWVLREAVNACNNNFTSKDALYWYPELLVAMQPTREELLGLQEGLFAALSCIYGQVPVGLLKLIRAITGEPAFRTDDFMAQLPVLLSSETKSVVKATLPVVADLLKKYPEKRDGLCTHLPILFIHKDEGLQVRAAKWIAQYGNKEKIAPTLSGYREMMLMAASSLLEEFLGEKGTKGEKGEKGARGAKGTRGNSLPLIREDNRVEEIGSVEALVFRLGQAFEDFRPDSIEVIPPALIRFHSVIDEEVLGQFSPAIKAAEKTLTKWIRDKHFTDEILAFYFLIYCQFRLQQLSQEHTIIKRLNKKFEKLNPLLEEWTKELGRNEQSTLYIPFIHILNQFLLIVHEDKDLPLLSTPTHAPCWIAPAVFFERLEHYRKAQQAPSGFDLQVAIQRLTPDIPELSEATQEGTPCIEDYMSVPFTYYAHNFVWDMSHLLRLFPNNPEALLKRFIYEYALAFDADCDNMLIPVLEHIRQLNRPVLPMGSLYIALCLLYQGKTTRMYAAEAWTDLTAMSFIDQQETGRALGKLLQNGHAPLKRLTDNLFEVMLNRSPQHNRALEQLIAACLGELDGKPRPYLKKLQEAYKEVLAQTH